MSAKIPVVQLSDESVQALKSSLEKTPQYVSLYEETNKVYTRRIRGFYQRLRRHIAAPLLLGFLLLPWLRIDNRPAVLLDLGAQKFHVLWMTFWPQDGLLLTWLLMIAALGLFAVTTMVGRVWCGFSCPQTVWTQMFIWVEDRCEGDRQKRIKLDARNWDVDKLLRKTSKHFLWLTLSLLTGVTFVIYFYGARELLADSLQLNVGWDTIFWSGFFTLATYLNAGWMREQMCKYICPYSRFQSVMYDAKTKAVAYDATRGDSFIDMTTGVTLNKALVDRELPSLKGAVADAGDTEVAMKRLPRNAKVDHKAIGMGDCIDCGWCVQVCPADIDIRDGLQADCINCGLCVDACDSIMDRMDYPRGLIRFASEEELAGNTKQVSKPSLSVVNLISPRLLGYSLVLLTMIGLFASQLLNRTQLDVSVVRDRGTHLYRVNGDQVENVYRLRLGNMSRETQRFDVSVLPPYQLKGRRQATLDEGEVLSLPLRVMLQKHHVNTAKQIVIFKIRSLTDETIAVDKGASFIAPVPY